MEDDRIPVKLSPGWAEVSRAIFDALGEETIRKIGGLSDDAVIYVIEDDRGRDKD